MTEIPAIGSIWKRRDGSICTVELIANQFSKDPEYPLTVVYRTQDALAWALPLMFWRLMMDAHKVLTA